MAKNKEQKLFSLFCFCFMLYVFSYKNLNGNRQYKIKWNF